MSQDFDLAHLGYNNPDESGHRLSDVAAPGQVSLAAQIPNEILVEIILFGVGDPKFGRFFAASCMRVARWLQPIVAPFVYCTVIIKNHKQLKSLQLALREQDPPKAYSAAKLVRTLVLEANDRLRFSVQREEICQLASMLDRSTWKELYIPIEILFAVASEEHDRPREAKDDVKATQSSRLLMPPSVTFSRLCDWYPTEVDYSQITKLRFVHSVIPFYSITEFIRRHKRLAPKLSHLAFTAAGGPNIDPNLIIGAVSAAINGLQCVVLMMPPPNTLHHAGRKKRIETRPRDETWKFKVPKLVVWEENGWIRPLYGSYNSEPLWTKAEKALADREST